MAPPARSTVPPSVHSCRHGDDVTLACTSVSSRPPDPRNPKLLLTTSGCGHLMRLARPKVKTSVPALWNVEWYIHHVNASRLLRRVSMTVGHSRWQFTDLCFLAIDPYLRGNGEGCGPDAPKRSGWRDTRQEHPLALREDGRRVTVVQHRRVSRAIPECRCASLYQGRRSGRSYDCLAGSRSGPEVRPYFSVRNWLFGVGVSSETCGRLCVLVIPRSASKNATGSRSSTTRVRVDGQLAGAMACLAQVSSINRFASSALSRGATSQPTT